MKSFYDEPDRDVAIDTLRRAREIGIDFLDSSNAYGRGRNGNWKAIAMSTCSPANSAICALPTARRPVRVLGRCIRTG